MSDHVRSNGPGMPNGARGPANSSEHRGPGGPGGPGGPNGGNGNRTFDGQNGQRPPAPPADGMRNGTQQGFPQNDGNQQAPPPPPKDDKNTSTSTSNTTTGILSGLAGLGVGAAAGSVITSIIKDKQSASEENTTEETTTETVETQPAQEVPTKCPYCGGNVDAGLTACPYCDSRLV